MGELDRRAGVGAFAVAVASAVGASALIEPWRGGSVAADAASCVLYFERIVARQPLEAFVNTTPKPLLTLFYGLLHAIGDWRAVTLATIVAWAVGVALTVIFAYRVGGLASAAFAAAAVAACPELLWQVSWGNALPWAWPFWLVAALALCWRPRRYGIAAVALALGGMVRLETLLFVGALTVVVIAAAVHARMSSRRAFDRRAWLLLGGWLAIPAMVVHDVLLTGNGGYWLTVARSYAATIHPRGPGYVTGVLAAIAAQSLVIDVLAIVGLVELVRRRQWAVAMALGGTAIGITAMLYGFAFRGLEVLRYYADPIILVRDLFAAIGAGALVHLALRVLNRRSRPALSSDGAPDGQPAATPREGRRVAAPWAATALAALLPAALAAAVVWPRAIATDAQRYTTLGEHVDANRGAIAAAIAASPDARNPPPPGGVTVVPSAASALLLVPDQMAAQMAVDLDLPLTQIAVLPTLRADPANGWPRIGQLIYVDLADRRPTDPIFRSATPHVLGNVRVVPLVADAQHGVWLSRIDDAASATAH